MNDLYLIPANSKRSMMIFSMFKPIDLIIFGVGLAISIILIAITGNNDLRNMLIDLIPLAISTFMIVPIPNHRNIWQFTVNVYNFFSNRRTYYWRGWCVTYASKKQDGE